MLLTFLSSKHAPAVRSHGLGKDVTALGEKAPDAPLQPALAGSYLLRRAGTSQHPTSHSPSALSAAVEKSCRGTQHGLSGLRLLSFYDLIIEK